MERIVFTRTQNAAAAEKSTRWDLIEAIAADATDDGLAITGVASQLAAAAAFEAAGAEYTSGTIKKLCVLAKFDHESTVKQKKEWRRYGWTSVLPFARSGWSPEAAYDVLSGEMKTQTDVRAILAGSFEGPKSARPFDERCARWIQHMNGVLMEGAALAEEAENKHLQLGPYAERAMSIYRQLAERQLDAELRGFLDSIGSR